MIKVHIRIEDFRRLLDFNMIDRMEARRLLERRLQLLHREIDRLAELIEHQNSPNDDNKFVLDETELSVIHQHLSSCKSEKIAIYRVLDKIPPIRTVSVCEVLQRYAQHKKSHK